MPAAYRLRPPEDEAQRDRFARIASFCFNLPRETVEPTLRALPPEMIRILHRGDALAGGLVIMRMAQWYAGRRVPMAGIAYVAVGPEYRAGGAGTYAMRAVVRELHREGLALSTLYPAVYALYRRAGYEIAGGRYRFRIPLHHVSWRDRELSVRRTTGADRAARGRFLRRAFGEARGPIDREAPEWRLAEEAHGLERDAYVVEENGTITGHLVIRHQRPDPQTLRVPFLVGTTRRALRRLVTVLVDHRTQGKEALCYGRPLDPLLYELPGPEWEGKHAGHWMLRILDVERALTLRGYPRDARGTVHFAVRDDLIRENRDRFVLEVEGGRGRVRRGGRGQVKIDVRGLAALYSGCLTPLELASLTPHLAASPAQCRALAPLFAGPAPYMIAAF